MSIAMLASGITSVVGGFIGASQARRAQDRAKKQMQREERAFNNLKAQRQSLTDLGNLAKDRSGDITNPFANIGVATQAAEFQAEEADVALANTLDTIMATGGGAGGATALAQMALQSKQGIQADIQKQELQNAKNVANVQLAINSQIAEGNKYAWEMQEKRDMMELDRTQNLMDKYEAQEFYAEAQKWQAYGNIASSITGGLGNVGEAYDFSSGTFT